MRQYPSSALRSTMSASSGGLAPVRVRAPSLDTTVYAALLGHRVQPDLPDELDATAADSTSNR